MSNKFQSMSNDQLLALDTSKLTAQEQNDLLAVLATRQANLHSQATQALGSVQPRNWLGR